jgi:hypothetical protein
MQDIRQTQHKYLHSYYTKFAQHSTAKVRLSLEIDILRHGSLDNESGSYFTPL